MAVRHIIILNGRLENASLRPFGALFGVKAFSSFIALGMQ